MTETLEISMHRLLVIWLLCALTLCSTTCTNCFHCKSDSNLMYTQSYLLKLLLCVLTHLCSWFSLPFSLFCVAFQASPHPYIYYIVFLCCVIVWCPLPGAQLSIVGHTVPLKVACIAGVGEGRGKHEEEASPPIHPLPLPLPILLCRLPCKVHYYFFGPANHPYIYLLENAVNATIPLIWPKATVRNPNVYI